MTNLLSTLTRIEPTRGLIEYVQQTKPFHSKILDIEIEYVYRDLAVGTATEYETKEITKRPPNGDVLFYATGYGITWDSTRLPVAPFLIRAALAGSADDTNNTSNSFIVDAPIYPTFSSFVLSAKSNRFALTTPYQLISSTDTSLTLSGDVTSYFQSGQLIGVNFARTAGFPVNRTFTVDSVSLVTGNTVITTTETIPQNAVYPGKVTRFLKGTEVPTWLDKPHAVKVTPAAGGYLPTPLSALDTYYIAPTGIDGEFNLARTRYPVQYTDYVDLTDAGLFELIVQQQEPFVPGEQFAVENTYKSRNNGKYTVKYVVDLGTQYAVVVYERIDTSTPDGIDPDGAILPITHGYDEPLDQELAHAPDLYARGRISEVLSFEFIFGLDEIASGDVVENPSSGGYSTAGFGDSGGWDIERSNYAARTTMSSSHIATPSGYDTTFFGLSAFDSSPTNPRN